MQRQFDCFDEFTLGRIQTWANDCGADLFFNVARDTARVVLKGRTVMYWIWGYPAHFAWRGGYITADSLVEEIKAFGATNHNQDEMERFITMLEMIGSQITRYTHE